MRHVLAGTIGTEVPWLDAIGVGGIVVHSFKNEGSLTRTSMAAETGRWSDAVMASHIWVLEKEHLKEDV